MRIGDTVDKSTSRHLWEGEGVQVDVLRVIENYYALNNLYDNREQKITEQAFCFRFDRFITLFFNTARNLIVVLSYCLLRMNGAISVYVRITSVKRI